MKRTMIALAVAVAVLAPAAAGSGGATLVIRHQTRGCHAWSLNGNAFQAAQSARVARGATLLVVDNDVMAHLLVQTSGPAKAKLVRVRGGMMDHATPLKGAGLMAHMGASVRVTFPVAGTYRFKTVAGEDYMPGMKTIGEDNRLTLTMRVA